MIYQLKITLPVCTGGRRACPPEDVGGIWGYYMFLEALQDENHPEHEMYSEWIGGAFDPAAFDLEAVNQRLAQLDFYKLYKSKGTPAYTPWQGQYLAFIYYYTKLNGIPPAQADIQRYFGVTPPSVNSQHVPTGLRGT